MRALLLTKPSRLELAEVPEPELKAGEVRVRVKACGICGSDVHGYDGSSGRRIPPLIMGHEAAGVIDRVAPDVHGLEPGARVTFDSTIYCGQCDFCRSGRVNLCDDRMVLGVSCGAYRRHGAFAEWVAVPARIVHPLPPSLAFEHAAMVEPVAVAVHAAGRTPVVPGGTVLVVGTGMIGLLVVQALRRAGWTRILAMDLDADRLALARGFGADEVLNAGHPDPVGQVAALSGGRGVDASFEVVGSTTTLKTAIAAVRKGGAVVLVGNLAAEAAFPLQSVVTREISLHGSCAISGEYPECIARLADGSIDVRPLVSAVAPLEEGPAWFDRLHRGERGLMKVILAPDTKGTPP